LLRERAPETPKETAVNKREGRVNAANLKGTYVVMKGKQALKMSDDKGRKVSKGGILIRNLLGGSSLGSQTAGGRAQLETDAASDHGRADQ
jgi:hypothetical protein